MEEFPMRNPWLKKNPYMSMWLSAANQMAGAMYGQGAAQAKRQFNSAVTKATNENIKLMSEAMTPGLPGKQPRRKRRQ